MLHTKEALRQHLRALIPGPHTSLKDAAEAAELISEACAIQEDAEYLMELKFPRLVEAHLQTQEFSFSFTANSEEEKELQVVEFLLNGIGNIAAHEALWTKLLDCPFLATTMNPAESRTHSPLCTLHPGIIYEVLLLSSRMIPRCAVKMADKEDQHGAQAWSDLFLTSSYGEYLLEILRKSQNLDILTAAIKAAAMYTYYAQDLLPQFVLQKGPSTVLSGLQRAAAFLGWEVSMGYDAMNIVPMGLADVVDDVAHILQSIAREPMLKGKVAKELFRTEESEIESTAAVESKQVEVKDGSSPSGHGVSPRPCGEILFQILVHLPCRTSHQQQRVDTLWSVVENFLFTLPKEKCRSLLSSVGKGLQILMKLAGGRKRTKVKSIGQEDLIEDFLEVLHPEQGPRKRQKASGGRRKYNAQRTFEDSET